MSKEQQTLGEKEQYNDTTDYIHCLNCGTELNGKFCHVCGQQAINKTPTVKGFIMEYLCNAFIWDTQFFKTIYNLLRRPGYLTSEFMKGKFISQEHPLKLNMFLLFVFVSMFLLFSGSDKIDKTMLSITDNEALAPTIQLSSLEQDTEFMERLQTSSRDTVQLFAPRDLAKVHPEIIQEVAIIEDIEGEDFVKYTAVIPRILIEDNVVTLNDDNYYVFNDGDDIDHTNQEILRSVGSTLSNIISTYFPMLMLLTTPFLAMAVAFIERRNKRPFIHHYIFALHYTAFIELLIIFIYVLFLVMDPSMSMLQWLIRISASYYLIVAIRRVYNTNSWISAILKALFTYLIYFFYCIIILLIIFIIACIIAAVNIMA